MNKAFLIGNLTRDPELRTTQAGLSVCTFTVAVSRGYNRDGNDSQADFIPVVTWRTTADNCHKYLRKGSQVAVFGSIQTRTYDAQDGSKRYVTEVIANEVKFLNRTVSSANEVSDGFTPSSDMTPVEDDLPF
ncbi:MAG: single-stranded DNA-binding protein [Eubacteriales bacterium]|nr:single-stranded DNA-binding protein [Eubacteriales bacterium]